MNNRIINNSMIWSHMYIRLFMQIITPGNGVTVAFILLMLLKLPQPSYSQTGIITGEVIDASTGETLPGANVSILGTTIGVATDVDGRYTLRRVPEGELVLVFGFIGYATKQVTVNLEAGQRMEQRVMLAPDLIEGDEIFVVARQRGQARALTRQRQSVNIRSVVSSEQMDRFADVTVSGALQRIAGMGHGGANIRGVGVGSSNVIMDGQRMGTTGAGDRTVDLGTISADIVEDLEIIKVITPDMDADALSGTINISTRRPIGGDRTMNARLGGGWNSRFVGDLGPGARISFSFGDSPRDNVSYGINLSYQRSTSASESVNTNWSIGTFDEHGGSRDILTSMSPSVTLQPTERYGAAFQLTYQPTGRTTFHFQNMLNLQTSERLHYNMWAGADTRSFVTPNRTGRAGEPGFLRYHSELTDFQTHQYTFRAGGRHLFDGFDMDYSVGWGHGRYTSDRYLARFQTQTRYEFITDFEDRWHPTIEVAPHGEISTFPAPDDLANRWISQLWDHHVNNEFTGSVNIEVPFSRGTFKFGSSALLNFKDGNQESFSSSYDRALTLSDFGKVMNADWRVFDRVHQSYHLPWIVDMHQVRDWYYGLYPHWKYSILNWGASSESELYRAEEQTYASYGMATVDIGRFRLLGGMRVEHNYTNYSARDTELNDQGHYQGGVDTTAANRYTHWFPNAQLVYALGRMSNVRLAYSRSIGRPDFDQLSPYVLRDHSSERLTHGNPNLKPMVSHNIDLFFEHYFMNVGQFAIGLYYKALSDFVYRFSEIIHPDGIDGQGLYGGWDWSSYLNGEEAIVYGLEVSWQQHLSFLPGFLGYTGIYANYSYAYSEAEVDERSADPPRLQRQRPHVVNAGLDYSRGRFSGQATYQWGAPSIHSYGGRRRIPETDPPIRVWFDRYIDAANDVSVTLRYRLTDQFRLWFDASNLLNHRSISYNYDRNLYPINTTLSGRTVNLGVRYTF
jgi:TonB-dependent receptor